MNAGEGENCSCRRVASATGEDSGTFPDGGGAADEEEEGEVVGEVRDEAPSRPGRRIERGEARGAGRLVANQR